MPLPEQGDVPRWRNDPDLGPDREGDLPQPRAKLPSVCRNTRASGRKRHHLDYSVSGFIRQMSIRLGSSVLETISDYNVLQTMLWDSQGSRDVQFHSGNLLEGMHDTQDRTGLAINSSEQFFAIPLISGVLGTLTSKMLPLGMMNNILVIELTFADNETAAAITDTNTWVVSDVEYEAVIVQLGAEVDAEIRRLNSSGVRIGSQTFMSHANVVPANSTATNLLISSNASSDKTLFTTFRKQLDVRKKESKSLTWRVNPFGDTGSWNYSVPGLRIPAKPVITNVEAYAELQKALHAFSSIDSNGLHTKAFWSLAAGGSYIAAHDLERFSHKSDTAESGIDLSSGPVYFEGAFGATRDDALYVNTFVHADFVLFIDAATGQAQSLY